MAATLLSTLTLSATALGAVPAVVQAAAGTQPAAAATVTKEDKERAELRTKTYKALLDLYQKKPNSRRPSRTLGYAVFVDTSYSLESWAGGPWPG